MAIVKQRLHRFNGSSYDDLYMSANVGDVQGTLVVANGGTGATTAAAGFHTFLNSGSVMTDADLATNDCVLIGDVSSTNCYKVTIANLVTYLKGA